MEESELSVKEKPKIYPRWEDINNPLHRMSEGVKTLAKYFYEHLSNHWNIYVLPFLNGDRPHIVLMNPRIGIMIWEVVDNNLDEFKILQNYRITSKDSTYHECVVIDRLKYLRNKIMKQYVPKLGVIVDQSSNAISVIKLGIYFSNIERKDVLDILSSSDLKSITIVGCNTLGVVPLKRIVPDCYLSTNNHITPNDTEIFDVLIKWLIPPYHFKEEGTIINLSPRQREHAKPQTGHYRIKGVAGCGKTLVLAYRAAQLATNQQKVLIITYNKTLWHYIRDQIARAPFEFSWEYIEFEHYHGFCKKEFIRLKMQWTYFNDDEKSDLKQQEVENYYREQIPNKILESMTRPNAFFSIDPPPRYDAILIDEGQDFYSEWYIHLCSYLTNRNELVLVCDTKQNVYGRSIGWTDGKMSNVQFRGPWRRLPQDSYRMSGRLVLQLNRFAKLFLEVEAENIDIESGQINIFEPDLIWENVSSKNLLLEKVFKAYEYFFNKDVHPSDIVVLVADHSIGIEIAEYFNSKSIYVNHVFRGRDKSGYKNKELFWMKDSRLKMCTIHSFKGWEIKTVIIVIPDDGHPLNNQHKMDCMVYTAMSRGIENVCIINWSERYKFFGNEWSKLAT